MAKNTETLTIKVDAQTEQARRDLHALEEVADDIKIDVQTDEAQQSISDLLQDVDKLSSEDATIQLKLAEQDLGRQLQDVVDQVEKLDAEDATIDIKMAQGDKLIGDIDQIESKLKEINSTEVAPDTSKLEGGLSRSKEGTDDLKDSTRGAHSALANMIGNSAQDLGNLGGIAQSAGVAIGQMAEYASDASLAGEALGSSLLSMATVAGPIALISIGVSALSKAMQSANEQAKAQAKLVQDAADAWAGYIGLTDELTTTLTDVGNSSEFANDALVQLGLSLFEGVRKEGDSAKKDLAEINDALIDLGVVTADTTPIDFFRVLGAEFRTLGETKQNLADVAGIMTRIDFGSVLGRAPDPDAWNEITVAIQGLSTAFAQSAPEATFFANEIAYAIAKGDTEKEIVEALADALIASGKSTIEASHDMAQSIYDGNKTIIESFENLDDVVEGSALNDFASKALEQATGSSLELAAAIDRIRAANPDASDWDVWLLLQQYIEDSGIAMRDFAQQVAMLNFDPMESDQFADLVHDVKDGTIDLANFDVVVQGLAKSWGISEEAVRKYILQEADKQLQDEKSAADETTVSIKDLADAYASINETLAKTPDLAGALETELNKVDDIFSGLSFDVDFESKIGDAIDALDGFEPDLQTVVDRWGDILSGEDIDIFGNVRTDDAEFLKRLDALRNLVQDGIVNAFKQGGTNAAQEFVDAQVEAIKAAHPDLTLVDIYRLLGLPDDGSIQTVIQPTIDEDARSKAEGILNALSGAGATDPRIAQIQVALITGEMTPQEALAATMQVYQDWLVDNPLAVPTEGDTTGAEHDVAGWRNDTERTTTTVPVDANTDDATGQISTVENGDYQATMNLGLVQQIIQGAIVSQFLDAVASKHREAQILAKSDSAGAVGSLLDAIAHDRTVHLRVQIDNYNEAERQLDYLARNRTSVITTTTRLGGTRNGAAVN